MEAVITKERLKDFLFGLQFYEYSCYWHEEVERMVVEFGLSVEDIKPFKDQQKMSYEVQKLKMKVESTNKNNESIEKIKIILGVSDE